MREWCGDMGDRIAVVTGHSSGIGRYITDALRAEHWEVHGWSRRDGVDVTSEEDVLDALARVDHVDALINAAGAAAMNHAVLTTQVQNKAMLDVNLLGVMTTCPIVARRMRGRRHVRIVNFTTCAVPLRLAGEAAYVAAKAGVEAYTRVLARELDPWGITVNAVGPAPTETAMLAGVSEEKRRALLGQLPQPRLGTVEDVWNVVRFLLAETSDAITGQVIYLGGAG